MQSAAVPDDKHLADWVERLARALAGKGWTMCTAESCTGGWIAKCCTDRAGSSAWFDRGFVTYSDEAKHQLLGVDPHVVNEAGAVSREVAELMASGARSRAGTDVAVAVTGVAGPDGGSPDKPVGTVWFAWATAAGVSTELKRFDGDRDAVRRFTVQHALHGLIDRL